MQEGRFYRFCRPLIPKPLRPLWLRYQELIAYLVFGVLSTVVNFAIYFPLLRVISYLAANALAWIGAVAFAYVVNKAFVFEDRHSDLRSILVQLGSFVTARQLSLAMEEGMLLLFVEVLHCSEKLTKLAAQVLVVLFNYVASKLVIFRKGK